MAGEGFKDYHIADIVSYRFFAVMAFAFPLGLFIKGRRLKPFFYLAALLTPALALAIIYAIEHQLTQWVYITMALWGVSYTCIHVTSLPFILLNAKKETHSEAIALFFLVWSISISITGFISFSLNRFDAEIFDEKMLLKIFAFVGFISLIFVYRIKIEEKRSAKLRWTNIMHEYDWILLLKAIIPTFIIAIGAGFTIPFINLFFLNVHHMEAGTFSILGSFTFLLVAIGTLLIPGIRRKYGYKVAITLIQSLSVFFLIMLATTEFYNHLGLAIYIAVFAYVVRQPLMTVAGPMTSELTMYYVGLKNQELVSALNVSIWSGSWFISSQLFRLLRSSGFSYGMIFLITAALYMVGVLLYYILILDYQKRKKLGLTDF